MKVVRSTWAGLSLAVLMLTACGSDSDASEASETSQADGTTSTATAQTTSEETTTSESSTTIADETTVATSEGGLPATPVAAVLSQTYLFGSEQGVPSTEQLPIPPETVTAHWYQSDDLYVVVYGALDPSLMLCPGNSLQTPSGFVNVSNAPLNDADCTFAPTVAEPPSGVVTCNGMVSYVTLIPAGSEGTLFGTIETMTDGLGAGLTSQVLADPENMPEIERSLIDC